MITAEPLGPGTVDDAVEADAVAAQMGAQLLGRRVVAERGDQLHVGARPGGGDRLIAALAAGRPTTARTRARSGRAAAAHRR